MSSTPRTCCLCWAALLVCSLVPSSMVHAEEAEKPPTDRLFNLILEKLDVRPYVRQGVKYDSNVFLTDDRPHDAWVLVTTPGIDLVHRGETLAFDTSVYANFLTYDALDEQDFIERYARGGFRCKPGKLYFGGGGYFELTSSPIDLGGSEAGERGVAQVTAVRLKTQRDLAYGLVGLDLDPVDIQVRFSRRGYDIHESLFDFVNSIRLQANGSVEWKVSKTWRVLASAMGGWSDYHEDVKNDYESAEFAGGFQWDILPQLGVRAEAGYRSDDFDPESGTLPAFVEDYDSWVARVTVVWKPFADGQATLAYTHRPDESVSSNFLVTDRLRLLCEKRFGWRWKVNAGGSYDHAEESVDTVPQPVKEQFSADGKVEFNVFRWMSLDVGYRYLNKRTDDDLGEYVDHEASAGVTLRF